MIRRFLRDTGIYGISGIVSKGVSVFLVPFYTRVLTPSDYGVIDMMAVTTAIVASTVTLQITQAVARFLADDKKERNKILVSSTALVVVLFTYTVFLIVAEVYAGFWSKLILGSYKYIHIIRIASLSIFLSGLYYFVQNQLRWLLRPKGFMSVSMIYTFITIPVTVFFVLILKTGVIGVFYAYIIGSLISFLLGFYLTRDAYAFRFSYTKLREMLNFSLPLVPSSVGVFFINYSQRILIRGMLNLSELGLFGIGTRLSSIVNIAFQSINAALVPIVYDEYGKTETPAKLSILFNSLFFILMTLFVSVSVFSKELIMLLTTPAYYSSFKLVPPLFISQIFTGMIVFAVGMAIKKKTRYIAVINIIGASLSIGLSAGLIYFYGVMGAAVAVAIQSFVIFIIQMYFSQKFYPVPYNFYKITFSFLFSILIVIFSFFVNRYLDSSFFLRTGINVALIILNGLVLVFGFHLISYRDIFAKMRNVFQQIRH